MIDDRPFGREVDYGLIFEVEVKHVMIDGKDYVEVTSGFKTDKKFKRWLGPVEPEQVANLSKQAQEYELKLFQAMVDYISKGIVK